MTYQLCKNGTRHDKWPSLETRRDYLKIIMFYKIIEGLVDITPTPHLTPVIVEINSLEVFKK